MPFDNHITTHEIYIILLQRHPINSKYAIAYSQRTRYNALEAYQAMRTF